MSRRRPNTQTKLTSAIGVMFAEVRTMSAVTEAERVAQAQGEYTLQLLLNSPLLIQRLAEKFDAMH